MHMFCSTQTKDQESARKKNPISTNRICANCSNQFKEINVKYDRIYQVLVIVTLCPQKNWTKAFTKNTRKTLLLQEMAYVSVEVPKLTKKKSRAETSRRPCFTPQGWIILKMKI